MADDVTKRLDDMRRRATEALHEARAIVSQMNTVETVFDLPLTNLSDLETSALAEPTSLPPLSMALGIGADARNQPTKRRGSVGIRPDEYFGVEPMEAAKLFLRSVGHAVHFDEITDAVQKGGAATKGADWRERLEISLKRSPYQVITVAEKTHGLAEFYSEDQLKRFRSSRKGESDVSTKKKNKPKPKAKATASDSAKKATQKPPKKAATEAAASPTPAQPVVEEDNGAASEPVH